MVSRYRSLRVFVGGGSNRGVIGGKLRALRSKMMAYSYRGMTIHYDVERQGNTPFWHATGYVDLRIGETTCAVFLRGEKNQFTSENNARESFLRYAEKWIDSVFGEEKTPLCARAKPPRS